MTSTQKITPTLFFSGDAKMEEIMAFYGSVFQDFEIIYQITLSAEPAEGKALARVKMSGLELILYDARQGFEFLRGCP